jgi:ATP-dependent Clp protease ATP-binding subunit ClpA
VAGARISPSIEIPFSAGTQRVLRFAAEEADRLRHNHIGTEHLLLGLLREEGSVAASVLTGLGLQFEDVRSTLVKLLAEQPDPPAFSASAEISEQIDHIKLLVEQLADMPPDSGEAHAVAGRIRDSLDGLKRHLAQWNVS